MAETRDEHPWGEYPPDHWYVILDARELPRRKPLGVRRLGVELAIWRDEEGRVRATSDRCPHRGALLSADKVRDGTIECPFHGFRFRGDGACVLVPCDGEGAAPPRHLDVRAYEVREEHGLIWLWWGAAREQYPEVPWYPELEGREYSNVTVESDSHWTRQIENQLDFAHLPFVHKTTIGIGYAPGITVRSRIEGDLLEAWLTRDEDEQGVPKFKISFRFPNTWMMPFGNQRMLGFVAFAPIDAHKTRLYLRTYVPKLPIPGLARGLASMLNWFNRVIIGQDMRVVETQPQGSTVDVRDERLVQADLPIAQFRKELRRRSRGAAPLVQLRVGASIRDAG